MHVMASLMVIYSLVQRFGGFVRPISSLYRARSILHLRCEGLGEVISSTPALKMLTVSFSISLIKKDSMLHDLATNDAAAIVFNGFVHLTSPA